MTRLFPEVPADHPAMSSMILNMSANLLGLGNAATPFGLKAMRELDRLNTRPGVATDAMALFLAINTAGVAVLPLGAVGVRATLGSHDPAGIIVPSILATATTTVIGVLMAKLLESLPMFAADRYQSTPHEQSAEAVKGMETAEKLAAQVLPAGPATRVAVGAILLALGAGLALNVSQALHDKPALDVARSVLSDWLLPVLMVSIALFGLARRVKVYEAFIGGAKEGFQVAITIIPYLVAILVSIGMFRASGAMDWLVRSLGPAGRLVGIPAEALPMVFIKPLSGSGALAVMTETMKANGPDSLVGYMVSVMNGSSETTFYVLAVYFGSVQVRATRHTLAACLTADVTGFLAAAWTCRLFFG
jgi:spore maturation protein SpmB